MVCLNVMIIIFNAIAWLLSPVFLWYSLLLAGVTLHILVKKHDMYEPVPEGESTYQQGYQVC
jgi:hypothetical protein